MLFHSQFTPRPRLAQSAKSKAFHFKSKLRRNCNSCLTQEPDRAFDAFHKSLLERAIENKSVPLVSGPVPAEVFRYFAKLLCGFAADSGAPRIEAVSKFARGLTCHNPIFLNVSIASDLPREGAFASHGGLKARFDRRNLSVWTFESELQVGPILYEFWIQAKLLARIELLLFHREFLRHLRRIAVDQGQNN